MAYLFMNEKIRSHFFLRSNYRYKQTINYDFCLKNKLICCL